MFEYSKNFGDFFIFHEREVSMYIDVYEKLTDTPK